MPVEFAELVAKRTRTVVVTIGDGPDDVIRPKYSPDRLTVAVMAEMNSLRKSAREDDDNLLDTLAHGIAFLATDLDITRDGKPWPIDVTEIAKLGIPLCRLINEAIATDFDLGKSNTTPLSKGLDDG